MKTSFPLKKLVAAAMFAALACVATMMISIPIPATNGYINLGDCVVILSGWLLGGVYGTAAAGIGSMLADLILGYTTYAPGTLVIKGLMALAAFWVFRVLSGKRGFIARLVSALCAEAVMVGGYFLYESVLLGYGFGAVPSIFSNLIQAAGGVVISVAVMECVKNNRVVAKLLSF